MASATLSVRPDYRPSYLAASITAACVFALYVYTLAPSTAMWDTSEYIAAAYTLGIPHPPGNPFFVLLGRVFSVLPIAPNVAMRINLLAAVCSAITAGLWFLITERVLVSWFPHRWQRIAGGVLAAVIGATAFTVWSQSVVNEKVYTVSLVGLALVAWVVVRWCDEPDAPGADRLLVLACYLMGLGYANHMAGLLALPGAWIAMVVHRPWDRGLPALEFGIAFIVAAIIGSKASLVAGVITFVVLAVIVGAVFGKKAWMRYQVILACAGALALGVTPFASQPIRAAHFPAINEGEPTGCRDRIGVSCTLSKPTFTRFEYNFNRGQYAKPSVTERQAPLTAQIGMWWFYFKWQWLRDPGGGNSGWQGALAAVFLSLGLLGGWVHYRRDRLSFTFFGPLMFTLTMVLIYYLNFKYGNSQAPELGDSVDREVRDRDYFYLWSFSAWSVWAALGLVYVWESIASLISSEPVTVGSETVAIPKRSNWIMASPILALALVPLFANWSSASRRGETDTADFARDMLNSVEPYGILVAVGDNDTFPLWYAQEVEGVRRDVLIANTSLMNTDWYVRQMIRRPIEEYDAEKGPALYRGKTWTKPTRQPLAGMTYDEADSIPLVQPITETMEFTSGKVKATITPRMLERADWLVYRLIADNPDRTVQFARSSGLYANELGFGDFLVMQGLTRKLARDTVRETATIKRVPNEGWVDVAATKALWDEFDAPGSLSKKGKWIDRPSIGIPYLYVSSGLSLSDALAISGDSVAARDMFDRAKGVACGVGLCNIFASPTPPAPPPSIFQDTARRETVPAKKGR